MWSIGWGGFEISEIIERKILTQDPIILRLWAFVIDGLEAYR